ncbi:MAG: hypothetical protein DRN25_04430 [Thermoplasmata archaeon]|nr:MAG: hypothetical protein DRN25_04430 [Thermoplasmata archaeon]
MRVRISISLQNKIGSVYIILKRDIIQVATPLKMWETLANFCVRCLELIKKYSKNKQQGYNLLVEKILGIVDERVLIGVVRGVYSQIKDDEELRQMWEKRFRCYMWPTTY